jgi:hypothetical protein
MRPDNRVLLVIPCVQLSEVIDHESEMLAPTSKLIPQTAG